MTLASRVRALSPSHFMSCPSLTNGSLGREWERGKGVLSDLDEVDPQLLTIRVRDGGRGAYVRESQLWGSGISHIEATLPTHLIAAPLSSPPAKSPIIPIETEHSLFP